MTAEDRCVCCGEIIPEGRQTCPNCERAQQTAEVYKAYAYTYNGEQITNTENYLNHILVWINDMFQDKKVDNITVLRTMP